MSYRNDFYDRLRTKKNNFGRDAIMSYPTKPQLARIYKNQYFSLKFVLKKYRFNHKNQIARKNRLLEGAYDMVNKKMECKKL